MKILSIITAAILAFSATEAVLPVYFSSYSADKIKYDGMVFEVRRFNEDELILTEYSDAHGEVVIPEKIGDRTVTAIDDKVFSGNQVIEAVKLPDTINYFGAGVFRDSSVSYVNIPKELRIIPDYTFNNCQELETVEFHDDILIISNTAFKKTNITLPAQLFERVSGANIRNSYEDVNFSYGDWNYSVSTNKINGILDVYINKYIGTEAEVVVPGLFFGETVKGINNTLCFSGKNITSVTFPEQFKEINIDFSYHIELKNVIFLSPEIDLNRTSFLYTAIEEISLPINNISPGVFNGAYKLRKINFTGSGTLNISKSAFENFDPIDTLTFGEAYEEINIGRNAFKNSSISEIMISTPCKIEFEAFRDCQNLRSVKIEKGNISSNAFMDCTSLRSVELKGDVTIERNAFSDCSSLKNVELDISKNYDPEAFNRCTSLTQINGIDVFKNGEFVPEYNDFILKNFYAADDVGFINQFVLYNVAEIVKNNIRDDMSDTQKVKILHDWVCSNTKYASGDIELPQYHNDASVFMSDSVVCEGYAKLCNLLYHEAGLETYYVNSFDHAWNIVRVDGHYFHVDATWDDGDKIKRDYFLRSDQQFKADGSSHAEWDGRVPSSLHSFQKAEIPECEYQIGDVNTDGIISAADIVKMSRYLLGAEPVVKNDCVLYDLDLDSTIDTFDLIHMRKLLINAVSFQ